MIRSQPVEGKGVPPFGLIVRALVARYPVQTISAVMAIVIIGAVGAKAPTETSYAGVTVTPISEELREELQPTVELAPLKPVTKKKTLRKTDTAPTTVFQDPTAFIKKAGPLARRAGHRYNVPPAIILAQALVESNAGKSFLATNANNYFGHKCMSKSCKKGHCVNRADDTHKDFFVKYPSMQASFEAHAAKISAGRYRKLPSYGTNYRAWAKGLKKCGYATDPNYASALINTIEKYGLQRFN